MSDLKMRVVGMEWMRASDILPHPENWREHGKDQKEAFATMMDGVGFAGALLAFTLPDGRVMLIDGHLRLDQHSDELLPVVMTDLTEDEAREILATHDPLSTMATINKSRLKAIHSKLSKIKGRRAALLKKLRASHGVMTADDEPTPDPGADVDRAAELNEKWQVVRGDVWEIPSANGDGVHRIMCGDSTCAEDVAALMDGVKAQGVFTSPPYAMQRKSTYGGIEMDKYVDWWFDIQSNVKKVLKADGSFFVNIKPHSENCERVLYVFDLVLSMVNEWGWKYLDEFIWSHSGYPGKFTPKFKNQFEPIYFWSLDIHPKHRPDNVRQESKHNEKTKRDLIKYGTGRHYSPTGSGTNINLETLISDTALPGNVLNIPQDAGFLRDDIIQDFHSATFPVKLPEFFIKAYSDENDAWYDPFLGSGTTLVACEQNGRIGYGMEISPEYVAVCLERLSGMGLEPRRSNN